MKHELLAPAGNLEAGYAALYYGADAVYLGLTKFSARAGAENFTLQELDEFTAYAHTLNRKVFVALNTILSEAEIEELPQLISGLKKAKIDALIIQDLGVFYLLKRLAPEIELHASTQMAVHNVEGARFLYNLGFKRVVLARELTLAEIKTIAKTLPDLDLEVFVHGALCYSYSGQCLFSALEYGKSANRGRCVYPCRAEYKCSDHGKDIKEHLFSMKDLALEEQVLELPVLSLKIEGRKKSPLYVAAVTNYYRHILDGQKKNLNEAEDIKQIFSRPWCRFHFNGKDKAVTDREFVGHRGLLIGSVEKVIKNKLVFKTMRPLARYDGIQIDVKGDEKPFGFGIKALYVTGKPQFEVKAGTVVELELPEEHPHLQLGAPVYLASASAVKGKYHYDKPKSGAFCNAQTMAVRVEINADKMWAMCGAQAVFVAGDFQIAKDIDKVERSVKDAFAKTGGTGILFNEVMVCNPEGRFAPASLLNDLRRQLVTAITENETQDEIVLPKVNTAEKYDAYRKIKIKSLNIHAKVEDFNMEELKENWFLLPQICRQTAKLSLVIKDFYAAGVRHFIAENYYAFDMLRAYKDVEIASGSFIYVMNRYAAAELKEIGVSWATMALESSPENMANLVKTSPLAMVQFVYGFPPLFTSAVCIRANDCVHCTKERQQWLLKQQGREYVAVSEDCQLQVFAKEAYQRPVVDGVYGIIDYKS